MSSKPGLAGHRQLGNGFMLACHRAPGNCRGFRNPKNRTPQSSTGHPEPSRWCQGRVQKMPICPQALTDLPRTSHLRGLQNCTLPLKFRTAPRLKTQNRRGTQHSEMQAPSRRNKRPDARFLATLPPVLKRTTFGTSEARARVGTPELKFS